MKSGLLIVNNTLRLKDGDNATNYAAFKSPSGLAASYTLTLPTALPGSTKIVASDASGNLSFVDQVSAGVSSVALDLPGSVFTVTGSPVTTSGTLTGSFANQTANTFFLGPVGAAGVPTFRAIAYADVSVIVGTTANTLAAGDDTRLHNQNTDTGTTAASFQIDSGNTGPRLKNSGGTVEVRNSADSAYAALTVGNLTVTGTQTVVNSNTIELGDNIITLNSDYVGASPTENAGIEVNRGTLTDANIIWDESNDYFKAGLVGSEAKVGLITRTTFVDADLTAGVLIRNHNLKQQYVQVQVIDNNNRRVIEDESIFTDADNCSIDLTSYGTLTGNWTLILVS